MADQLVHKPENGAIDARIMQEVENYSGKIVHEMMMNKTIALENLNNRDSRIRYAALFTLDNKWGLTPRAADLCEEWAIGDCDAKVRAIAAICLSGYYRKRNHSRIAKILASIVSNESEVLDIRWIAYRGLYILREDDPLNWPSPSIKFPEDINWDYVARILK